jgi:membrane dipeptidase
LLSHGSLRCQAADKTKPAAEAAIVVSDRAQKIHDAAILIDGHNDLPWVIRTEGSSNFEKIDISLPQPKMHTDIPRLRAGGVKAQFWSVYVPAGTRPCRPRSNRSTSSSR